MAGRARGASVDTADDPSAMPEHTPIHSTSVQPFGLNSLRETIAGSRRSASPTADEQDLPTEGDIVGGQYRLIRRLGQGMFGRVYVARRTDVPEHCVALKVVSRAMLAGRAEVERELVMLAAASHPNIVQLKDHGVTESYAWLTMPLLEGEDLCQRLERGPLGLREAYEIFLPIARGLEALHAVGLRHQDIKPENIFLARFGGQLHPVLLDLGVAVQRDASFVAGTVLYAAPEQVMALSGPDGKPALSERIDTYCLASTLLRSLVGPESFPGERAETPYELAASFEERELEPLGPATLPELSGKPRAELGEALGRWLARDPAERSSMQHMAEELEVLLGHERELAAAVERAVARQKVALQRVRIAAGAMLLVGLGVAAWGFSKRETLRLAGELERVRAEGAASFDKLDTCIASHELTRQRAERCAEAQGQQTRQHEHKVAQILATSRQRGEQAERRLEAARARLRTCRDDAAQAAEQWLAEQQRIEEHWSGEQQSWLARQEALADERDELRRLRLVCETEASKLATARQECREDLASCIENRDICLASQPPAATAPPSSPSAPTDPAAEPAESHEPTVPPTAPAENPVAESAPSPPPPSEPPVGPAASAAPGAPLD